MADTFMKNLKGPNIFGIERIGCSDLFGRLRRRLLGVRDPRQLEVGHDVRALGLLRGQQDVVEQDAVELVGEPIWTEVTRVTR